MYVYYNVILVCGICCCVLIRTTENTIVYA